MKIHEDLLAALRSGNASMIGVSGNNRTNIGTVVVAVDGLPLGVCEQIATFAREKCEPYLGTPEAEVHSQVHDA